MIALAPDPGTDEGVLFREKASGAQFRRLRHRYGRQRGRVGEASTIVGKKPFYLYPYLLFVSHITHLAPHAFSGRGPGNEAAAERRSTKGRGSQDCAH